MISQKTRKHIKRKVKSYSEYKKAILNPDLYDSELVKKARLLSSAAIQFKWVEGDVSSAEKSFYNINQKAAVINPKELILIKSREKPSCISVRAIMRMGLGHKYWSSFAKDKQDEIEAISKELYELMFLPKYKTHIKTLDVPMCGKHDNRSLPVIYDYVKICNRVIAEEADDNSGDETIRCLKQIRKIA